MTAVGTDGSAMTDEPEESSIEDDAKDAPSEAGESSDAAKSRAARLEAKAARLREREQERAEAAKNRAAAGVPASDEFWRMLSIALAVALVVVLAVTIPLIVHYSAQADSRGKSTSASGPVSASDATRATVLADARQYATDFGTYNYQTIDADFARIFGHLTPQFAKTYQTVSAALKETDVQLKASSTAKVQAAAIDTITADTAVVLLFLDQTVTTNQSSTPRLDRNRLRLTLKKQPDGSWLMDALSPD